MFLKTFLSELYLITFFQNFNKNIEINIFLKYFVTYWTSKIYFFNSAIYVLK